MNDDPCVIPPDELDGWITKATAVARSFNEEFAPLMTKELADRIRMARIDQELTWRGVAVEMYEIWPDARWNPPSNQLAGRALCDQAAIFLGEDPKREPWN